MTKFIIFIILACTLQAATAQDKKQTRDQCMAKCLPLIAEFNDHARHEQVLKKIQAKREGVTDPAILKELDKDEADEMEKYQDKHEKMCRGLCKYFPETL